MHSLPRLILNVLTALSLVLCVATVTLWVRSHYVFADQVGFGPADATTGAHVAFGVQSEAGRLTFSKLSFPPSRAAAATAYAGWYWHELFLRGDGARVPPAFTVVRRRLGSETAVGVTLPHRAVAATAACGPAAWAVAAFRRRRGRQRLARDRLCAHCLYDLHGNVSGVCPECGTKVEGRA